MSLCHTLYESTCLRHMQFVPLSRLSRRSLAAMSMRSCRSAHSVLSLDSSVLSDVWKEEVAEVEMLLESYFMHVDNVYNRLKVGATVRWCTACRAGLLLLRRSCRS